MMVYPLPFAPYNNTRCKTTKMATKIVVNWFWMRPKEGKWNKLPKDNANALEKEFQDSKKGIRKKREIYTCFGSVGGKASVSFTKMETFCVSACCVKKIGEKVFQNHMVYKLKREVFKVTDIDSALKELKKNEIKKKPVWYWISNTKPAKLMKVSAKENNEIEDEFKGGSRKGYHCFGDGHALAYINFTSMKTECLAALCKKCEIGSCLNNMAFKIVRMLE